MNHAVFVLLAYAALMLLSTMLFTKKESSVAGFCTGGRNIGWVMSALSIAATWIWAPALFTSAEAAYTKGFAGLFWFLAPNVLCLILFIPFAKKIRREMPEGITLSGYMYEKYGSASVRNIYLFQLGALSVLSTGVQLLAGGRILSMLTGVPFTVMTIVMAAIAFSYSQFSGIKASVLTDAVQMVFILAVSLFFVAAGIKQWRRAGNAGYGPRRGRRGCGRTVFGRRMGDILGFWPPDYGGAAIRAVWRSVFLAKSFLCQKGQNWPGILHWGSIVWHRSIVHRPPWVCRCRNGIYGCGYWYGQF